MLEKHYADREFIDRTAKDQPQKPKDMLPAKTSSEKCRERLPVESHGKVKVLLSHLMTAPEVTQDASKTLIKLRIPPVFSQPGKVRIAIEFDGVSVDMKTVDVFLAPASADRAIELLYPVIERGAARPTDVLWTQLISNSTFGVTPRITTAQLQQLRDELPVIMEHPDWAEIAEMLVGRVEARVHHRQLIVSEEGRPLAFKEAVGELPSWPGIVTRCLAAKPQSPFAQSIQQDIRSVVKDLRILNAQRHDEDIWPIIKESSISER